MKKKFLSWMPALFLELIKHEKSMLIQYKKPSAEECSPQIFAVIQVFQSCSTSKVMKSEVSAPFINVSW